MTKESLEDVFEMIEGLTGVDAIGALVVVIC